MLVFVQCSLPLTFHTSSILSSHIKCHVADRNEHAPACVDRTRVDCFGGGGGGGLNMQFSGGSRK